MLLLKSDAATRDPLVEVDAEEKEKREERRRKYKGGGGIENWAVSALCIKKVPLAKNGVGVGVGVG